MEKLAILLVEALIALALILGGHALRHRLGKVPFHVILCTYTALLSLTIQAGSIVALGGLAFQVGPLVFLSPLLAGILALYACDGPKAMCKAVVAVGLVGLLMPAALSLLHYTEVLTGAQWPRSMQFAGLRILTAGVAATVCGLLFLTAAWEFLKRYAHKLPLFARVLMTLLGVFWLDAILFTWGAYAGGDQALPLMKGGLAGRLVLTVVFSPCVWFYLRKQQSPYEVSLRSQPVFSVIKEISKLFSLLTMNQDEVRRRAWAQQELKNHETRLALAIEASGSGVFGFSIPTGKGVVVDRSWADILGYRLGELPPKEKLFEWWLDRIHPDDREQALKTFEVFVKGLTPEHKAEYRMLNAAGEYISVLSLARAMERDAQGKVVSVAGVIRDVTERRKWEDALETSRRYLSQIIDSFPDAVLVIDANGKVSAWNRAMEELTGVEASQMLGKGDFEYAIPFYGYRRPLLADIALDSELAKSLDQVLLNREAMGGVSAEVFHPNLGAEGSYLWTIARPLYDAEGNATGAIQSIRDVTQRRIDQQYQEDLINRLQAAQENLRRLSLLDALTGLANRRHFEQAIQLEVRRAAREEQPLGLVMCDLDYFKNYNDTYGHQAGDICLKKVGQAIKKVLNRPGDLAARYGGEEFVVLLPNTGPRGSLRVAKAMQNAVAELEIPHQTSLVAKYLTISLGVANTEFGIALDDQLLVAAADQGLYLAKDKGRNCIVEVRPPIQARLTQIK